MRLSATAESRILGHFALDPGVVFLNHGSFGATPRRVLELQTELRERLERNPMQFYVRDLEGLLDETRRALGAFVKARPEDLVFVPNATTGVNAVLRSYALRQGDELLVTDHEYNACRNVLDFVAASSGATVVVAHVPFPLASEEEVVDAVMSCVTPRTRLALVDHVTSQTGLVFPLPKLARALSARDVEVLVDGAHAPGMVDLSLEALAPYVAFYTANCHKWLCAPKGAAFLWVREDHQDTVRPHVISHGANTPRKDRSRYLIEFDWPGTTDPTPVLCIPRCIEVLRALDPSWRETNRALALQARRVLCEALAVPPPAPESMIGSLAAVPLPDGDGPALERWLWQEHRIEVPIMVWPAAPKRLVRVSAQLYNTRDQYVFLAERLLTAT